MVNFPIDRTSFFTDALNTVQNFRKRGKLIELGKSIHCPINIIHGDYDPHPLTGVVEPLKRIHKDITVSVILNCGHKPWIEKTAYNTFFELLSRIFSNQ
ncbi:MAG: alpha/beta hydrolase [Candidatus Lokiarchaeota archaeon]|nr:alpha/beta hydrolase [Candidatus Harpocratesius repetitus]